MADFFVASLGRRGAQDSALDRPGVNAEEDSDWTTAEAFIAVLFSAATCDGNLAREEHEELLALAHRSRALRSLSVRELADLNARIVVRSRKKEDVLKHACEALPQDMRLSVFAHALDLALADGDLVQEEASFLNTIIRHLGIGAADIERIADVLTIKNRY